MNFATAERQETLFPEARFDAPAYKVAPSKQLSDDEIIHKAMVILDRRMRLPARDVFSAPDSVKRWLRLHFAGEFQQEHFTVLFLDSQNRLIEARRMFSGTLTQTSVYPREVVRLSLQVGAAAVVLSHNHPSGTTAPSRADECVTQALKSALGLIDVRVLDHVIVAGTEALSMAERGLL